MQEEVQKVTDAAIKQENVKRNNEGEPTFSLRKILSVDRKKHEGAKFKIVAQVTSRDASVRARVLLTIFLLTTQVTSTEGHLNTYNIHIWHKLQKSMFGGVRKESFVLTSFVLNSFVLV